MHRNPTRLDQYPLYPLVSLLGNGAGLFFASRLFVRRAQPAIRDSVLITGEAVRIPNLQNPAQGRDLAHAGNAHQQLNPRRNLRVYKDQLFNILLDLTPTIFLWVI